MSARHDHEAGESPLGFQAAPLWRRLFATLLDALVPLTLWALGTWALVSSDPESLAIPPWNLFDLFVDYLYERPLRAALSLIVLVALQIAWPVVFRAATPGKRALGVALVDGFGAPPPRLGCLAWALWRVPSIALGGLGVWWAVIDPERRTLHDRLARLWLVRAAIAAPPTDGVRGRAREL